eukprot:TRINITY_DN6480_c0_g1_i1.p1 TRINITY_DN6480_c0_g1~~TRINITY_DN6480_c0_g1_i1.p1  ORF type:complete len:175 (-),score=14.33 TRINITY_DN6480_c0_g1_i1:28-552(-)
MKVMYTLLVIFTLASFVLVHSQPGCSPGSNICQGYNNVNCWNEYNAVVCNCSSETGQIPITQYCCTSDLPRREWTNLQCGFPDFTSGHYTKVAVYISSYYVTNGWGPLCDTSYSVGMGNNQGDIVCSNYHPSDNAWMDDECMIFQPNYQYYIAGYADTGSCDAVITTIFQMSGY